MSRTIRKDRNNKKYNEGRNKPEVHYRCTCYFCTGGKDRDEENAKIFKRNKHKILQRFKVE